MLVAADVGYGWTKVLGHRPGEPVRRAIYPSAVAPRRGDGELSGVLGGAAPRHRVDVLADDGSEVRYLVGDAALAAGAARTWSGAADRPDYGVLILSGCALVGADGAVDLAVGMPVSAWAADREGRRRLRERLLGLAARVSVDGGPYRRVVVLSAQVYPQAVAAYLSVLGGPDGHRLAGRPVGVLDIGHRTSDFTILTPGQTGQPIPDEERTGSMDIGVSIAYDLVRAALAREAGGAVPPDDVLTAAVGRGEIAVHGKVVDVRSIWAEAAREVAGRIAAHVRRAWGDRLPYLAAIAVVGGGGAALGPYLGLPGQVVVADGQWANVEGYLRLLQASGVGRTFAQASTV